MKTLDSRGIATGFALLMITAVIGCGGDNRSAASPTSNVIGLQVKGPATIPPNGTARFEARLQYSGGKTEDVTAEAQWSTDAPSVLDVQPNGVVSARARGEAKVNVRYQSIGSAASVTVLEDNTFKFSGHVMDRDGDWIQGIAGATVEVVQGTGAGQKATTGADGSFNLFGLAGRVSVRASASGYSDATIDLVVDKFIFENLRLAPLGGAPGPLAGAWTMTVAADPSCTKLAETARTRVFSVDIEQAESPRVAVRFSSPSAFFTAPVIGSVVNDVLSLPLPYWPGDVIDDPYYALVDGVSPGFIAYKGAFRLNVSGTAASGALEGDIDLFPVRFGLNGATACSKAGVTLQRR